MDSKIVYNNVWKSFDGNPVVRNVSFEVKEGEVVVLLGPNGSGKSTLFKMTVGIVKPDRGQVFVNEVDASADPLEARKIVGFMPEEIIIYESLKIEEYLEFILSIYGRKVDKNTLQKVVDLLGLREHLDKFIGELSHGTKRKVLLAALMLREPRVLALDEVFTGLDPVAAKLVKTWIREAADSGVPVLVSTHILPIAEAIADRVLIIHRGEIVAEGKPGELKELFGAKELEDVFLKIAGYSPEYEEVIRALYR